MAAKGRDDESAGTPAAVFATTHWSVVLTAGKHESPQAAEALDALCRAYWYPLYAFVRRQGYSPEDAQDLTQAFFAHTVTHPSAIEEEMRYLLEVVSRQSARIREPSPNRHPDEPVTMAAGSRCREWTTVDARYEHMSELRRGSPA